MWTYVYMGGRATPPPSDREIGALANEQRGVVSRAQLRTLGLTDAAIDNRVRRGRLIVLHPGVYAVGHSAIDPSGWRHAALLGGGDLSALSHYTAAGQRLMLAPRTRIHIAVPARTGRLRLDGVVAHRPRSLPADEVETLEGLRVTTVSRTLVDLAAVATDGELTRAVEQAERHGVFDLVDLRKVLGRSAGRRGIGRLERAVAAHGPGWTRNDLETAFREMSRAAGGEPPIANAWIAFPEGDGYEVDFHWPRRRLVIETDGFDTHKTRAALQRDRARDRRLRRHDYAVERFAWEDVMLRPNASTVELIDMLARNPARPRPGGVD